jgi:hypothetical protein
VAGEGFPVSAEVADPGSEWGRFTASLRADRPVAVKAVSYQYLLRVWHECLPGDEMLADLAGWIDERIQDARHVT